MEPHRIAADIRAVTDRTSSPMVILEPSGAIRYANPAAGWLVGMPSASLRGLGVLSLVHPRDRRRVKRDLDDVVAGRGTGEPVEYRVRGGCGGWKTISAVASNLLDVPSMAGILVSATDVTEQRAQEESLRNLALRDPITGLDNLSALRSELTEEMTSGRDLAVCFFDLDDFKRVNDCLGHSVGDAVLRAVAERLRSQVPARTIVAHLGADTFVAVLVGISAERAVKLAWELNGRLADPLFIAGHELRLQASVGMASRDTVSTSESILRDADAALTRAKSCRRGGVEAFSEALRTAAVDRLTIETELRYAVARDELRLHFQPIVQLGERRVIGSEALLRWARRGGELVSPATFIPVAEETGLILPIGEWVLGGAVAAVAAGRTEHVSVNLSPRQLLNPGLPSLVERLLRARQVRPEAVVFEVTEAVVVENFRLASESLNRVRGLGCKVGLDDFGTGYSSLGYLRRLPVDFIKLDRELVTDIDTDPQAAQLAAAVIALAQTLSLAAVAEGIERPGQADVLEGMGCEYGQGWLFGRPTAV